MEKDEENGKGQEDEDDEDEEDEGGRPDRTSTGHLSVCASGHLAKSGFAKPTNRTTSSSIATARGEG